MNLPAASSSANPSCLIEAGEWWPEGRPWSVYSGPFRNYLRERYQIRPAGDALPSVVWQGHTIPRDQIHAQAVESARFSASLDARPAQPASGLVYTETSPTGRASSRNSSPQATDMHLKRLRRMKRSVLTSARLHAEAPRPGGLRVDWLMVTLTLRADAAVTPKDISALLDNLRKWTRRAWPGFTRAFGFRYVWVMELQGNGRPHYHVLLAVPRKGKIPFPDERGWWSLGSSNVIRAKYPVGYLAKYASKLADAGATQRQSIVDDDGASATRYTPTMRFPKGFRISGSGGLDAGDRKGPQHRQRRFWLAPSWARDAFMPFYASAMTGAVNGDPGFSVLADLRRAVGGFIDKFTGEFARCPWTVVFDRGFLSINAINFNEVSHA